MLKLLGRGATGEVYKAREVSVGGVFVVKKLHSLKDELGLVRERNIRYLKNELQVLKDTMHPNIVGFKAFELAEGNLCIYLEYMSEGKNIRYKECSQVV